MTRNPAPAEPVNPRQQLRTDHPDSWIPIADGDTIRGTITDVQEAWSEVRGDGGSWYPLLEITVSDATGYETGDVLKVHCFSAVLYNETMRKRPVIGETVAITFVGEREAKQRGHSPTKVYKLVVDGRTNEGSSVYDSIGREQPASTVGRRRPPGGGGRTLAQHDKAEGTGPYADAPPASAPSSDTDDIPF